MRPLQLLMPLFRDKNNISEVAGPLVLATLAPSFVRGDLFLDLHEKEVADVGLGLGRICQRREAELKRSELCFGRQKSQYDSGHGDPTNFARLCNVLWNEG